MLVMDIYVVTIALLYTVSYSEELNAKQFKKSSFRYNVNTRIIPLHNPPEPHRKPSTTFSRIRNSDETHFPPPVQYWNFWRSNGNDSQMIRNSENSKTMFSTEYKKWRQDLYRISRKSIRSQLSKFKVKPVPCARNMCICTQLSAVCSGRGRYLSYIPQLPSTITDLYFYNNYLTRLTPSTFNNLTGLNLEYLFLANNSVNDCEPNAFNELVHLKVLDIENELFVMDLKKCTMGLSTIPLKTLNLMSLDVPNFTLGVFSSMVGSSIEQIQLSEIYIGIYNQLTFSVFRKLKLLKINYCKIHETNLVFSETMLNIDLSYNSIFLLPKLCNELGLAVYPNLMELTLDDNFIRVISGRDIDCLKNLRVISVSGNLIQILENNIFSGLPLLTTVSFNEMKYDAFKINRNAFNSSSLENIYLTTNGIGLLWSQLDVFEDCPNLEKLDLTGTTISSAIGDDTLSRILSPLKNLKILFLSITGISYIPSVIPIHLTKLKELYLETNNILGWPKGYFTPLVTLEKLYLHNNRIATVNRSSFPDKMLKRLKVLSLGFNPLACSCELLWFKTMLHNYNQTIRFPFYPDDYVCASPPDIQGELLINTKLSDKLCILSWQISIIIMSTTSAVLLLIICGSIVYRYRWKLRFAVYMIRFRRRRYYRRFGNEDDNPIDAYLSCSELDLDFVLEEMVPTLETEHGFRIFIPERDGIGNKIDGIIENMDASRKAILCVSNNYACDNYCEFEASLAYERYISEKRDIMIVILLEEIDALNVTKTVHKITNKCDYICWGGDEESRRLFWIKLLQSINNRDDLVP